MPRRAGRSAPQRRRGSPHGKARRPARRYSAILPHRAAKRKRRTAAEAAARRKAFVGRSGSLAALAAEVPKRRAARRHRERGAAPAGAQTYPSRAPRLCPQNGGGQAEACLYPPLAVICIRDRPFHSWHRQPDRPATRRPPRAAGRRPARPDDAGHKRRQARRTPEYVSAPLRPPSPAPRE